MATDVTIGGNGVLFVGEDKTLRFEILDDSYDPNTTGSGIPVDMSGWTILFDVRLKDTSPPPAILSKSASISGTFNADRSVNTQRAIVVFTDDDLNLVKGKTYRHSLKRMNSGSETVLTRGDFSPEKATAP